MPAAAPPFRSNPARTSKAIGAMPCAIETAIDADVNKA
jgi:hypothetical protein